MNYEFFLSKEDYRSYSLLKYLEESSNLSESILKIQEELSLSTFLLKKTIENLNDDLDELGISEHLKILATGTEVSLEIDGHYSSGFLLSNYIKRSIYLDLLIEFFREDYTTLEVFADEHHISYSSAYTILQELKKVLKKHQIFFDKKKIIRKSKEYCHFLLSIISGYRYFLYESLSGRCHRSNKSIYFFIK